ncbi:hypothetical protein [Maribacter sp. 2307UL18-2]|uniref:hypothetical protein n=1 Tax=Maribacter sp. 2307UL18-2 TaxID=3386274 RepID=UPI0039BD6648
MKYFVSSVFFFLLLIGCSDSETTPEISEELVSLPTIATVVVTDVTDGSVVSGGNVTDDGGAAITDRGVVWGTSTGPTISDNKIANGTGKGKFNSTIEGLEANVTYHVRAYATNSAGTAYGNELSFNTLESEPIAKIFEGDVILTSQKEVDDFGALAYTEITGALKIKDENNPSSIKNLKPLNTISVIGDSLVINNNQVLIDFEGFSELKKIDDDLIIANNNALNKIDGFEELLYVGGEFIIYNEKSTFSLNGFNKLTTVERNMALVGVFAGKISDIVGFDNLESINGLLTLSGVTGEINAFKNLSIVRGRLLLQELVSITDFRFLSSLAHVEGQIRVAANGALESFEGLESLTDIDGLYVLLNKSLKSLKGLESLKMVEGGVTISINEKLTDLDGLQKITKITNGGLDINQNQNLISLHGIDNLNSVAAGVEIWNNISLESLDGLQGLELTGSGENCFFCFGRIRIGGNESLLNIDALENLTTAWYADIDIEYNLKLENLNGLRNLIHIYKSPNDTGIHGARIEGNSKLNDVCGLKKVYEYNSSRYYINGLFNGPVSADNPEGDVRVLLNMCD